VSVRRLELHRERALACTRCSGVVGPVVIGPAVKSEIYLVGQAPGPHEGAIGRPFAWTAGRTLFGWFDSIGASEALFRERVYMAAVLRCFPGKGPLDKNGKKGGDRVPAKDEIERCRDWMQAEMDILRPKLVLAIGALAIAQLHGDRGFKLTDVVGDARTTRFLGHDVEWFALPHPSGLSSWFKIEPGKTLTRRALRAIAAHPSWKRTFPEAARSLARS
jgi:uracil-DNA glycosylase